MSIRTRVLSVTLALAVAGFVVTLDAIDDKVLIVRDGSVEIYLNNSHLADREGDRHKWSKKADLVQVFQDPTAAEACTTKLTEPVKFKQVTLKIRDLTNQGDVDVIALNEGFLFKKLKLVMPSDWRFAFRQYRHRLVFGAGQQQQERDVKLQQVVITASDEAATQTSYPANPSTASLCVMFTRSTDTVGPCIRPRRHGGTRRALHWATPSRVRHATGDPPCRSIKTPRRLNRAIVGAPRPAAGDGAASARSRPPAHVARHLRRSWPH